MISISLYDLLREFAATGTLHVKLDKRKDFYNYGEVTDRMNDADGCFWDIYAPGISFHLPTTRKYKISRILGVLMLPNGNHKLIVTLAGYNPNWLKFDDDLNYFISRYRNVYHQDGTYQVLSALQNK